MDKSALATADLGLVTPPGFAIGGGGGGLPPESATSESGEKSAGGDGSGSKAPPGGPPRGPLAPPSGPVPGVWLFPPGAGFEPFVPMQIGGGGGATYVQIASGVDVAVTGDVVNYDAANDTGGPESPKGDKNSDAGSAGTQADEDCDCCECKCTCNTPTAPITPQDDDIVAFHDSPKWRSLVAASDSIRDAGELGAESLSRWDAPAAGSTPSALDGAAAAGSVGSAPPATGGSVAFSSSSVGSANSTVGGSAASPPAGGASTAFGDQSRRVAAGDFGEVDAGGASSTGVAGGVVASIQSIGKPSWPGPGPIPEDWKDPDPPPPPPIPEPVAVPGGGGGKAKGASRVTIFDPDAAERLGPTGRLATPAEPRLDVGTSSEPPTGVVTPATGRRPTAVGAPSSSVRNAPVTYVVAPPLSIGEGSIRILGERRRDDDRDPEPIEAPEEIAATVSHAGLPEPYAAAEAVAAPGLGLGERRDRWRTLATPLVVPHETQTPSGLGSPRTDPAAAFGFGPARGSRRPPATLGNFARGRSLRGPGVRGVSRRSDAASGRGNASAWFGTRAPRPSGASAAPSADGDSAAARARAPASRVASRNRTPRSTSRPARRAMRGRRRLARSFTPAVRRPPTGRQRAAFGVQPTLRIDVPAFAERDLVGRAEVAEDASQRVAGAEPAAAAPSGSGAANAGGADVALSPHLDAAAAEGADRRLRWLAGVSGLPGFDSVLGARAGLRFGLGAGAPSLQGSGLFGVEPALADLPGALGRSPSASSGAPAAPVDLPGSAGRVVSLPPRRAPATGGRTQTSGTSAASPADRAPGDGSPHVATFDELRRARDEIQFERARGASTPGGMGNRLGSRGRVATRRSATMASPHGTSTSVIGRAPVGPPAGSSAGQPAGQPAAARAAADPSQRATGPSSLIGPGSDPLAAVTELSIQSRLGRGRGGSLIPLTYAMGSDWAPPPPPPPTARQNELFDQGVRHQYLRALHGSDQARPVALRLLTGIAQESAATAEFLTTIGRWIAGVAGEGGLEATYENDLAWYRVADEFHGPDALITKEEFRKDARVSQRALLRAERELVKAAAKALDKTIAALAKAIRIAGGKDAASKERRSALEKAKALAEEAKSLREEQRALLDAALRETDVDKADELREKAKRKGADVAKKEEELRLALAAIAAKLGASQGTSAAIADPALPVNLLSLAAGNPAAPADSGKSGPCEPGAPCEAPCPAECPNDCTCTWEKKPEPTPPKGKDDPPKPPAKPGGDGGPPGADDGGGGGLRPDPLDGSAVHPPDAANRDLPKDDGERPDAGNANSVAPDDGAEPGGARALQGRATARPPSAAELRQKMETLLHRLVGELPDDIRPSELQLLRALADPRLAMALGELARLSGEVEDPLGGARSAEDQGRWLCIRALRLVVLMDLAGRRKFDEGTSPFSPSGPFSRGDSPQRERSRFVFSRVDAEVRALRRQLDGVLEEVRAYDQKTTADWIARFRAENPRQPVPRLRLAWDDDSGFQPGDVATMAYLAGMPLLAHVVELHPGGRNASDGVRSFNEVLGQIRRQASVYAKRNPEQQDYFESSMLSYALRAYGRGALVGIVVAASMATGAAAGALAAAWDGGMLATAAGIATTAGVTGAMQMGGAALLVAAGYDADTIMRDFAIADIALLGLSSRPGTGLVRAITKPRGAGVQVGVQGGVEVAERATAATTRVVGKRTPLWKDVTRSILEDRATFGASKDFFKRWNRILGLKPGAHGWSMEHMIIKQRWYRGSGARSIRNALGNKWGGRAVRTLQALGDAGWNQVPVSKSFNTWLFRHPVASAAFNYGAYPVAGGVVYVGYETGKAVGRELSEDLFDE